MPLTPDHTGVADPQEPAAFGLDGVVGGRGPVVFHISTLIGSGVARQRGGKHLRRYHLDGLAVSERHTLRPHRNIAQP
jgi:hypothetical protein